MTTFLLRCDHCGRSLNAPASSPVKLVALFKASETAIVPPSHAGEQRRRCRACGFVNVFHPASVEALLAQVAAQ